MLREAVCVELVHADDKLRAWGLKYSKGQMWVVTYNDRDDVVLREDVYALGKVGKELPVFGISYLERRLRLLVVILFLAEVFP